MKIEALNKEGVITVKVNNSFSVNMDEFTSDELVTFLMNRLGMCEEAATHLACAMFSLSYVVE